MCFLHFLQTHSHTHTHTRARARMQKRETERETETERERARERETERARARERHTKKETETETESARARERERETEYEERERERERRGGRERERKTRPPCMPLTPAAYYPSIYQREHCWSSSHPLTVQKSTAAQGMTETHTHTHTSILECDRQSVVYFRRDSFLSLETRLRQFVLYRSCSLCLAYSIWHSVRHARAINQSI